MENLTMSELMEINGGWGGDGWSLEVGFSSERASTPHIEVTFNGGVEVNGGAGNFFMKYTDDLTNSGSSTPVRFRDYY